MIDLIELLFNQYHDRSRLYITWDAASWHSSTRLLEWVDELNAGTRHADLAQSSSLSHSLQAHSS